MRPASRAPLAAIVVAALVSGCSDDGAPAGAAEPQPTGVPAVTADESLKILKDWTDRYDRAVTSGNERLWRGTVTGGLETPVDARVLTYGKLPRSATISLVNPVLYVPRLESYPQWFGFAALERSGGTQQQILGVFVRASGKDGWRAAHWLTFKGKPPELAFDRHGYAIPAPDRGLPAAHARYVATGDEQGLTADAFSVNARTPRRGDWTAPPGQVAPGPGPSYALRTKDGGSLVWYGLAQRQTLRGGTEPTLPGELRNYLAAKRAKPGSSVRAGWQWLAIGYAPKNGKGRVLGESVSLTGAG